MKIAFCGFMGSGKTTLAQKLSPEISVVDLDDAICNEIKAKGYKSISSFVDRFNWENFREIESNILAKTLKLKGDFLVSLGGGAINERNLKLLRESQVDLVWLKVDFETCWNRIKADEARPLVKKGKTELFKLFLEREVLYRNADFSVNPDAVKNLQALKALIHRD